MNDFGRFDTGGWEIVRRVRNPWGVVPLTAGGRSLPSRAQTYMDTLLAQQEMPDSVSRRHHYVPQSYLRQWSYDGKRIWTVDTTNGRELHLGIADVCVKENFYRVTGPDGVDHNRVELLFGVVDAELRRVQKLLCHLDDPETLEFDDLIGLGVSMAVQRMRTTQQRRLQVQRDRWLHAQNPDEFTSIEDHAGSPYRLSGIHTELLFKGMWDAADVLTTKQIEIWHDPLSRFMTCDAPVFVPFRRNSRPGLMAAPYVIWPISPERVVALSNDPVGEKAVIREATSKMVGTVREGVLQSRERMVFATEAQRRWLPKEKVLRRRTQTRWRCSDRSPTGEYVPPPGCCVEMTETFAVRPDVALCNQGLHTPAPSLSELG